MVLQERHVACMQPPASRSLVRRNLQHEMYARRGAAAFVLFSTVLPAQDYSDVWLSLHLVKTDVALQQVRCWHLQAGSP